MAFPQIWEEKCLIGISKKNGSEIQFAPIVEDSISINEGEKGYESIPNMAGGRIDKKAPQADGEITMTIRSIELDSTTGVGLYQQFAGGTYDTSEPLETVHSDTRDEFRVAILWTNDSAAATAGGATAASTDSTRFYAKACRMTVHSATFSIEDGFKAEVTFKFPAKNKTGTYNYFWQSGDQTALVTLGSYT